MRVRAMQRDVRVVLKQGGHVIKSKRQQVVRPAEMVALKLERADLELVEPKIPLEIHIET